MTDRICSVGGCERPNLARGMCRLHYDRWYRATDRSTIREHLRWPENLLQRVQPQPNGCVHFMGHTNTGGYGEVWREGRNVVVHRAMWELKVGPIPDGLTLDHTCHNEDPLCDGSVPCLHRRCVNVEHLVPKPMGENTLASPNTITGINARKTHCLNGHEFNEENTYIYPAGGRECRPCRRERKRQWREANPTRG